MGPPDLDRLNHFVGRRQALELVDRCLAKPGSSVIDCEGGPAMGKSLLAAHIYREQRAAGRRVASFAIPDPSLSSNAENQLITDHAEFEELLRSLAGQLLDGDDVAAFEAAASAHKVDPVMVQEVRTFIAIGTQTTQRQQADLALRLDMQRARDALTADFAARLAQVGKRQRIVALLDDYHNVMGRELRLWLANLMQSVLPAGVVVVAFRRPSDEALFQHGWEVEPIVLGDLELDEVNEYLCRRLETDNELWQSPERLERTLDRVMAFSEGHPLATYYAVERIRVRPFDETLQFTLDALPLNGRHRLAQLAEAAIPPDRRPLFEMACVLREFDEAALASMVEGGAGDGSLVQALAPIPLVRRVPGRAGTYAIHEFVRQQKLDAMSNVKRAELHAQAAKHYLALAQAQETTGGSDYARCVRYEQAHWQAAQSEWLYHLVAGGDTPHVLLEFARVYIEVFWWWAMYIRYPFCERLIQDVVNHVGDGARDWSEALREFHLAYTPEQETDGEESDWGAVESALLTIRRLGGLDAPLQDLSDTQRRLRALTAIFLAEARWGQDPNDTQIDRLYGEAHWLCRSLVGYRWNLAWVRQALAELAKERGEPALAARHCEKGLRLASEDHEVIANLRLLRARLADNRAAEAEEYASALVEGYAFQIEPHEPDAYTARFYQVLTDEVLDRLRQLTREGASGDAAAMAERLHQTWASARDAVPSWPRPVAQLIAEGDWYDLRACLFPTGPRPEELDGSAARRYARTALRHITRIRQHGKGMAHATPA